MKGQRQQDESHGLAEGGPARGVLQVPIGQIVPVCLAAVIALLCIVVAPALADEDSGVPGQPYPPAGVEEAAEVSDDFLDQLIDPQAAKELPHRDLGRDEASELAESVFGGLLESAAGPFG